MVKEQELGLRQALGEERRRREHMERRLQSESSRRQQLVEKEVKLREKQFSQVRGGVAGDGLRCVAEVGHVGQGQDRHLLAGMPLCSGGGCC